MYAILLSVSGRRSSETTDVARALAVEIRAVHRILKVRVREHGGGQDLTPSQVAVLVRLETDGATTISSLARAEGMRPQSMSEIVAPLEERSLIARSPDPNDGRQTLVSLTLRCRKWIQESRAASHDWLSATIAQKLSAVEQRRLLLALRLLRRVVEE